VHRAHLARVGGRAWARRRRLLAGGARTSHIRDLAGRRPAARPRRRGGGVGRQGGGRDPRFARSVWCSHGAALRVRRVAPASRDLTLDCWRCPETLRGASSASIWRAPS